MRLSTLFFLTCMVFPKKKIEIKTQHSQSPWITRGLQKSSKRKQRYIKNYWKKRAIENEIIYQKYKYLLEKIKKKYLKEVIISAN